ncbi:YheT family hydrolase [Piscinibacter sakaiensis]|uniref:YheT family hydrolase n=1 Tax=Piscinibacter sakaiensis TaxID=1547922 RepID=UPI003AACC0E2
MTALLAPHDIAATGVDACYRAPWWLPGPHLQTIVARWLAGSAADLQFERETWETPDGDFIDVDTAGPNDARRVLVLFHGLEGSSASHYVRIIFRHALRAGGWRCAVPHFRGCSGRPNQLPRAYHAGDSAEIGWILERFSRQYQTVCAAGVSLGGNALLKWLGEQGAAASQVVARAVAISAPVDLNAFGGEIGRGFNRLYGWHFLYFTPLRRKALAKLERFPDFHAVRGIDASSIRSASTLPAFDAALTAPLHGFADHIDYWTRSSALPLLARITVPTLLINARNDPFLPEWALPTTSVSSAVEFDFPQQGGHGGFPGCRQWLARRVLEFLDR